MEESKVVVGGVGGNDVNRWDKRKKEVGVSVKFLVWGGWRGGWNV